MFEFGQIWSKICKIWSNLGHGWPGEFGKIWKKFGKNLKKLENELKNVPKSKVVAIKNSKTGTFQTAGAAQPIELSKKRRHFQLGFLKIIFEKFLKN